MRCYKCGSVLDETDLCPVCGIRVTSYKRIVYSSNVCYNDGLLRANAMDLTGAEKSLLCSLRYHKRNVQARNLLGLVYYREGRLAQALSEWIVSSNIMTTDNPAALYINDVEKDKAAFEEMNRAIKQYNECLAFLESGNEDLAYLQLKKLLASEPRFVEPYQLMALFLMRGGEYRAAKDCLKNAQKLDRGSFRTQRYLEELKTVTGSAGEEKEAAGEESAETLRSVIREIPVSSIVQTARDLTAVQSLSRIILGAVLAAAVMGFLIMPARIQSVREQANQTTAAYGSDLTERENEIRELNQELTEANQQIEQANAKAEAASNTVNAYEELIEMREQFNYGSYNSMDMAIAISEIDESGLREKGKEIYKTLYDAIYDEALTSLYNEGERNFGWGEWETAAKAYENAISLDPTFQDGYLYYRMGQAYENAGDRVKAKQAYERLLDEVPDSEYAPAAREALNSINAQI